MPIIGGRAHTIEQIHEVGRLGYPYAEIDICDPEVVEHQFDELVALKTKYGIYYLAHYPNEGDPSDVSVLQEKFIPKMKKLIELTQKLEIQKGTMHFWVDKRWAKPAVLSAKIPMLSELASYASENGIVLCLENLTSRHDSFSDALQAAPDLMITLDIGHGELLSKENTSFGFMDNLFEKIAHVHVHDNRGGTSVKDDLHLPLGHGIVDYPKILSTLKEKGYTSTITMEVKPEDMNQTRKAIEPYFK